MVSDFQIRVLLMSGLKTPASGRIYSGQIYIRIEKPSVYTREKLRAYKSLDADEYFVCGHVQNVKYHDMTRVLCGEIRILYYVLIPVNTFNRLQPHTPPVALKWL